MHNINVLKCQFVRQDNYGTTIYIWFFELLNLMRVSQSGATVSFRAQEMNTATLEQTKGSNQPWILRF